MNLQTSPTNLTPEELGVRVKDHRNNTVKWVYSFFHHILSMVQFRCLVVGHCFVARLGTNDPVGFGHFSFHVMVHWYLHIIITHTAGHLLGSFQMGHTWKQKNCDCFEEATPPTRRKLRSNLNLPPEQTATPRCNQQNRGSQWQTRHLIRFRVRQSWRYKV